MAANRTFYRLIALCVCFVLVSSITPMVALAEQGSNYASPEPDTTFVLAPYPVLSGVVLLFINNETGELTAEVRGGNTERLEAATPT